MKNVLAAENIQVKIKDKQIIDDISFSIEPGKIYSIIGPNGSGKTTLLRAISRNLKPNHGSVYLKGKNIFKSPSKHTARIMAVLTQVHSGMNDVTVSQLISYGRFAHRDWWKGKEQQDSEIIDECIEKTNLTEFRNRKINTLSGGERQRAWIAMALAQKPELLIMDEPTTFLDISHQLEVMELISKLNQEGSITILMVLHDINHAARFSDELFVIKEGKLYAKGRPWEIINPKLLQEVFNVEASITEDEEMKKPIFYAKRVINY